MNLSIINLSKSYGPIQALDAVEITLKSSQIYGILGHNGAGKSTLLKILATLVSPTSGKILLENQSIFANEKTYRKRLGYMPQQQQLIPNISVESFLYYMSALKGLDKPTATQNVQEMLKLVHLETQKKQPLSSLSGGMKQRVLIAQALLNDPEILLLDEPTVGLDPVERRSFRELIARVSKDKIVLLATHVISDIEYIADRIIIMEKGKIIANNTQEKLLEHTHVYESLQPLAQLQAMDDSIKLVNIMRTQHGERIRYISKNKHSNQVTTLLDDVYLDWLG